MARLRDWGVIDRILMIHHKRVIVETHIVLQIDGAGLRHIERSAILGSVASKANLACEAWKIVVLR
jgi:hypothetical protein